jgi:hypothetical protein
MSNPYEGYEDDYGESNSRRAGLFIGLGFLAVVAIVLILVVRATHPPLVAAPTAYASYSDSDQSFTIDQPVGWTVSGGGSGGIESTATFRSGNAEIKVGSDLGGSLLGDVAQAQNNQFENMASLAGVNAPPPVPPIVKVHAESEQEVAANYANYQELPMQVFNSKLGEGRYSEFTGQGATFVGPVRGYRATLLSSERRITVVTVCPVRNWAILQPAFLHILQSVDRGKS